MNRTTLHAILHLTRLDKPVGIWLLLWPTWWGLLVAAQGYPSLNVALVFTLGTVLMRSAGCALNDIADRHWDGRVSRTQGRPLATGALTVKQAYLVAATLAGVAFVLVCQLHWQVVLWSVPALLLAISYPYTKRFFAIPQAYLGLAFGFGIPMAFVAIQGQVPIVAWVLLVSNVCWSVAYDTEYAMVDRADDIKIGIRSSAITFGHHEVMAIMLCFAGCLGCLGWVAWQQSLGWPFWTAWLVASGMAYQQFGAIRGRQPASCFQAFLSNVWLGGVLTVGLAAAYLLA